MRARNLCCHIFLPRMTSWRHRLRAVAGVLIFLAFWIILVGVPPVVVAWLVS